MKRSKKHRVKLEKPETSTSRAASEKDHDLAYYVHDRVELMHQVFSVIKSKELKAMAPECVRHISVSDLQELCMEELLGISSKRLCAILDGASPPSDTESSSESEHLETISLDSISSDEEILSQVSSKKHKKHKHRSKSKCKRSKAAGGSEQTEQAEQSRRAGLTVLELLELQARARAIRAQLQQEQAAAPRPAPESVAGRSDDDEVEIKEEAAEVVEISSEDEKPGLQELEERVAATTKDTGPDNPSNPKSVTKKINDLIITVPQARSSRKIKLKRNTVSKPVEKNAEKDKNVATASVQASTAQETKKTGTAKASDKAVVITSQLSANDLTKPSREKPVSANTVDTKDAKDKGKNKDRKKKRKKEKIMEKDGSDHDEIMLQLSDTEKMDLLEDLEEKKSEKPSESEDSSSDSDSEENSSVEDSEDKKRTSKNSDTKRGRSINVSNKISKNDDSIRKDNDVENLESREKDILVEEISDDNAANRNVGEIISTPCDKNDTDVDMTGNDTGTEKESIHESESTDFNITNVVKSTVINNSSDLNNQENNTTDGKAIEITCINDIPLQPMEVDVTQDVEDNIPYVEEKDEINNKSEPKEIELTSSPDKHLEVRDRPVVEKESRSRDTDEKESTSTVVTQDVNNKDYNKKIDKVENSIKQDVREKSDGELSDRDSSEVEASDFNPDVVCISDDEEKRGKKKKKKEKKCKKDKKSKKKKDFRESADQNFYTETNKQDKSNELKASENEVILVSAVSENSNSRIDEDQKNEVISIPETDSNNIKTEEKGHSKAINSDTEIDDDVYEILELSDDSTSYKVENISISKEPTAEEIEAFSAKIDQIGKDAVTHKDQEPMDINELENVSWKDRYLDSTKVKKVLSTANILNAIRRKNLALKKKLEESKNDSKSDENVDKEENVPIQTELLEGSIEQYKTLEASTKYVDPVKEDAGTDNNGTEATDNKEKEKVTNEMKKDAKQLLKMYKMLLKYNDLYVQKDPSKKRKKKKKSKDKGKDKNVQQTSAGS